MKIVSCHTADYKPVKQEVNRTVILPPLMFPAYDNKQKVTVAHQCIEFAPQAGKLQKASNDNHLKLQLIFLQHPRDKEKKFCNIDTCHQCYKTFFCLLLMTRPNKLECLHLAITFHTSLSFAGNTRSLPKKEASEKSYNWVCSGLSLKF